MSRSFTDVSVLPFLSTFLSHRGETRRNRQKFHRHKERNTQDFRSVYFNLFLVNILPNFGSLFYTTVIPYKPLYGTPLLGLPVSKLTMRVLFTDKTFTLTILVQYVTRLWFLFGVLAKCKTQGYLYNLLICCT